MTLRPVVLALCLGGSGAAAGAAPAGGYPPDLPPAGAALQSIEQAVLVKEAVGGTVTVVGVDLIGELDGVLHLALAKGGRQGHQSQRR